MSSLPASTRVVLSACSVLVFLLSFKKGESKVKMTHLDYGNIVYLDFPPRGTRNGNKLSFYFPFVFICCFLL